MMNAAQVRALFEREAVLLGSRDGVPLYRVVELFGKRAAAFVEATRGDTRIGNTYGIGDFQLPYVTYCGFVQAASYANVEEIGRDRHRVSLQR